MALDRPPRTVVPSGFEEPRRLSRERFLAKVPLFSSLDDDELRDILLLARPFSFEAGHLIFDQGVDADGMYVLEQGQVQLWVRLLGEEEIALGRIGPGGVLGEFSLIDRRPRSASAVALEHTEGYFFGNYHFELLRADRRPAVVKTMSRLRAVLCERLRAATQELSCEAIAFYGHTEPTSRPPPAELPVRSSASELDPSRLRALPFFSAFSASELAELLAPRIIWTVQRGHTLFCAGDAGSAAFVTIRGAIEVIAGPPGSGSRCAILGPGRLFGLVAPLDGGLRHTSCVARENSIVLEIPQGALQELMKGDTAPAFKFADAVHGALIESLRGANRTLLSQSAMGRGAERKRRAPSLPPP